MISVPELLRDENLGFDFGSGAVVKVGINMFTIVTAASSITMACLT